MANETQNNWIQEMLNVQPMGEVEDKVQQILDGCSISRSTWNRWKKTGLVPRLCDQVKIKEILTIK